MVYRKRGRTGLKQLNHDVYEEFLPELRWPYAGAVYQEMADNDPVIGSIMYLAEMLIRGTTWSVEPVSDSADDVEAAKFLEECMHDMDMSWADTISEILSMMTYGFSFHEILYKVRRGPQETNKNYRSKFNDGRVAWRNLPIRSQATLAGWDFVDDEPTAFMQRDTMTGFTARIPFTKGMLFRTKIVRNNPEGKSLLRNAYRPWYFKKHFEEVEGIGIERDLAGFPVIQPPAGTDLWNSDDPKMVEMLRLAEDTVRSIRRDAEEGLVLPPEWELSLLSSTSSRQINIGDVIERYDNRIAITLLSDLVLLGSNSGSFALAETKQTMLSASLQAQLENIADVFNKDAVPKLFKYNPTFSITEYPKIKPGQVQSPSLREVALLIRAMGLNIAGDKPLQDYLRGILTAPKLTDEIFEQVYLPQTASATEDENLESELDNAIDTDLGDDTENALEQSDLLV